MTLIKRYPNRKLYDTSARQYVSLEAVAALIRGGETVEILVWHHPSVGRLPRPHVSFPHGSGVGHRHRPNRDLT